MIRRIIVENFKSFKKIDLNLGNLVVVVGANSAGKSNFLSVFRFLADICNHDLKNAISLQGGSEFLTNLAIGDSHPLTFSVEIDTKYRTVDRTDQGIVGVETKKAFYKFSIVFDFKNRSYEVKSDVLKLVSTFYRLQEKNNELKAIEKIGDYISNFENDGGILKGTIVHADTKEEKMESTPYIEIPKGSLLLEMRGLSIINGLVDEFLGQISFYDIDPQFSKRGVPILGLNELDEDGSNLPIALRNSMEIEKNQSLFNTLLRDLIPTIDRVKVRVMPDRTVMLEIKEKHLKKQMIPAPMLSDGTIRVIAMLQVLFMENMPLIVIEEPERNIHPYLISRLTDLMRDASDSKQIILSTHNPLFLKHMALEEILFVYRNKEGISEVVAPSSIGRVVELLKSEMGLDDLYTKMVLEELAGQVEPHD